MRREISVATLAKAGAFNRPVKFTFHQMIWRMENDAILSPVQRAVVWRVQIVWPNGTVQHVGPFASEKRLPNGSPVMLGGQKIKFRTTIRVVGPTLAGLRLRETLARVCGFVATAYHFFPLRRCPLWTFLNIRIDNQNAANEESRFGDRRTQKAFPPICPAERSVGRTPRGIIVGVHDRQR